MSEENPALLTDRTSNTHVAEVSSPTRSMAWYTASRARTVLEEVDGFPIAREYEDAIAAEIAFSRTVEASGRALAQVGRRRHSRIGHREWEQDGFFARLRRSAQKRLR